MVYPTIEDIFVEYLTFVMLAGDDLGIFLAQFRWLWARAHPYGVSHLDGIHRLIELLPLDWVGYAVDLCRYYVFVVPPFFDTYGDFPGFIGEIQSCFTLCGEAPRGPYIRPGDLARVGSPVAPPQYDLQPEPVVQQPAYLQPDPIPSPPPFSPLGRRARGEFEAGPSHSLMDEVDLYLVSSSPASSLAGLGAADPEARELRAAAAERRRRGKAPIVSSGRDDSDEQKITVGTGRLQPLPIPSEDRPVTPPGEMISTSRQESTLRERGPLAWAIRHWGAVTRGPHAPGTTIESAFIIDESSDEEEPEEETEDEEMETVASTADTS